MKDLSAEIETLKT